MYINGEWIKSDKTFEVFNPANGAVIGSVPDGGREFAKSAIEAADDAFKGWSGLTAYGRSAKLYRAHELMMERQASLAEIMTRDIWSTILLINYVTIYYLIIPLSNV